MIACSVSSAEPVATRRGWVDLQREVLEEFAERTEPDPWSHIDDSGLSIMANSERNNALRNAATLARRSAEGKHDGGTCEFCSGPFERTTKTRTHHQYGGKRFCSSRCRWSFAYQKRRISLATKEAA